MERDRISNLPEPIIHDILSRMATSDAVITSVLSKFWAETWFAYPILSFCDDDIIGSTRQPRKVLLRKRKNFIDLVKGTLQRFRDRDLSIKEFKLNIYNFDFDEMPRHVWFLDLFSTFPFLEHLKIHNCTMSETINISSDQLKVLELLICSNLKVVNIDAPILLSCRYRGHGASKPIISFLKSSCQLEVNVEIDTNLMDIGNLREFIQNFKPQNGFASLSLLINQPPVDGLNLEILPVSSTPPSIKHLNLCAVPNDETLYLPLVNSLLSSCRPAAISLSLNSFFCSKAFIEFLYETLMRRKEDECFCSSGHTKCWWHGLKDVKVSRTGNTNENIDLKTILDAWSIFSPHQIIFFRLEL